VYGKPLAREDGDFTATALRDLVARHEGARAKPSRMEDLAADFYEKLAGAIVAFEMPIDRIEGQFKLGQNRSQDDRRGMLRGLDAEGSPDADALAEFIRRTLPAGASSVHKIGLLKVAAHCTFLLSALARAGDSR
jgi:transcriptional regulator